MGAAAGAMAGTLQEEGFRWRWRRRRWEERVLGGRKRSVTPVRASHPGAPLLRGLDLVSGHGPGRFSFCAGSLETAGPDRERARVLRQTQRSFRRRTLLPPASTADPSSPPGMDCSAEKLRGLRITSQDKEDDEAELAHEPPPPAADYEDDEDDDEEAEVVLGFLEKPKRPGLLLRHLFPSKAGGIPVRATTRSYRRPFRILFKKNIQFSLCIDDKRIVWIRSGVA